MSVQIEKLIAARNLITTPGSWGKGFSWKRPVGCRCAGEALDDAGIYEDEYEDLVLRAAGCNGSITAWNDAPERTQAEVVAAFDRAIELARAAA